MEWKNEHTEFQPLPYSIVQGANLDRTKKVSINHPHTFQANHPSSLTSQLLVSISSYSFAKMFLTGRAYSDGTAGGGWLWNIWLALRRRWMSRGGRAAGAGGRVDAALAGAVPHWLAVGCRLDKWVNWAGKAREWRHCPLSGCRHARANAGLEAAPSKVTTRQPAGE